MDILNFLKKKYNSIMETEFECRRDSLTIRGTEYRPAGDNLPVAIVCHGIRASQGSVRKYAAALARAGYCAYCFDFCGGSIPGTGRSDGATTEMSVLTEVQDLETVIGYVRSLPYTGSCLLLMGCSQGGFVSALVAAKHPGLVSKLVLFYPALCIPDNIRAGNLLAAQFDPKDIPEQIDCGSMKLGRCYAADVMDMDAIREISSYCGPVLIVHGTRDSIVSPDYSRQAQRTYPNARLRLIPGGAHGFKKIYSKIAIFHLRQFAEA